MAHSWPHQGKPRLSLSWLWWIRTSVSTFELSRISAPKLAVGAQVQHVHTFARVAHLCPRRSWVLGPRDKRNEVVAAGGCFLPKRWVHTWSGHTKGVNAVRFFPGTGHLLLSAGLDGKVKIWDVYGSMKCMRSYLGHSKVRATCDSTFPQAPCARRSAPDTAQLSYSLSCVGIAYRHT